MVITKREDVTKQGFCKLLLLWRKHLLRGSLFILVLIQSISLSPKWVGWGWGLTRLFEVGANSRLGAYSNKIYGSPLFYLKRADWLENRWLSNRGEMTITWGWNGRSLIGDPAMQAIVEIRRSVASWNFPPKPTKCIPSKLHKKQTVLGWRWMGIGLVK